MLFPTSPCSRIVTASNVSVWLISTQCCNITSSLIPLCHCFSSDSSSCGYHFHHKYHLKLYTEKDKWFIKYPLWKRLFVRKIHFLFARLVLTLSSMLDSPLSFLNTCGSFGRNARYSIVDTRGLCLLVWGFYKNSPAHFYFYSNLYTLRRAGRVIKILFNIR